MDSAFDSQIAALKLGDHACMIYDSPEEQVAAAVPFVREGVARNEACIYVVDELPVATLRSALDQVVDVDAESAKGRLRLVSRQDLPPPPGPFDPGRMAAYFDQAVSDSLRAGFAGLRIAGPVTWAMGAGCACEGLAGYEARIAPCFASGRLLAICHYNRQRLPAHTVHGALRTHPVAIIGDQVCSNLFYEPPELVLGGDGEAVRVAWMMEQLHHARQAEMALLQMNTELERYAYVASHDLQEPLRMIRLYLELLERNEGERMAENSRGHLRRVVHASERMSALIHGILDYSRADQAEKVVEIDGGDLMRVVLGELDRAIIEVQADVVVGDLPRLRCEPTMLSNVLCNIIGNALKFRRGNPRIEVTCVSSEGEHVLAVRDNGIGIAAKDVPQLFRIFKRLHTAHAYPGSGIGLASCKRIVERHGGRLWIESQPGQGSTFYIALPR